MAKVLKKQKVVIIGAGPAGLGCAYEFCKKLKNQNIELLFYPVDYSVVAQS